MDKRRIKGRKEFLAVGSATIDVIVKSEKLSHSVSSRNGEKFVMLKFASKMDVDSIKLMPGGSAANSAVTLSRLGEKTAILAAVGKGLFGEMVIEDLKKHRVDTRYVKVLNDLTASAIDILAMAEKSELVYRGATALLGPEHFSERMVKDSKRIFLTSMASGKNYGLFRKIVAAANRHGKPIIFAPSITMLREHARKLRKIKSDITIMNYEEGVYLTHKHDIKSILKALPGRVKVITAGKNGAYATEGAEILHVKAQKVKAVDTTGAGDCFSGAFAHSYYRHGSMEKALKEATAAATLKVQSEGARFCHGRSELETCLRKFSKKLVPKKL